MRRMRWMAVGALAVAALGCERKPQEEQRSGTAAQESAKPDGGAAGAQPGTPPQDSNTILIGEVGSLTGSEATFGISTRNGIDLALKQENANGGVEGKKVVVRVYDDQGKPEEAANAATRLISQDRVLLILGEVASTNSLAMAAKAQPAQVPMITPSSTNTRVTEVGDYIFRVCFIDPFQGFAMAKFATENLKSKTAAVLKDQKSDYSLGLADVFTKKFTEFGGKILGTEAYAKGDTDFRAQLTSIKRLRPDVLYVPGYYTDVGLVARQARELGVKSTLLGGDGWDSDKLFELGGSAVDGSYFTNHYSPQDPSPRVQRFIQEYKAEFGSIPDSLAALGYDAARVAIEGMRKARELTGPAVRDALAQTKDFPGVAGNITLDEKRNAVKPAVVLKVTGGKTEFVASVAP
ncbi:MAG TPA: ABC transporter substrate-binding protein [Myxococcaceae bacterium]|nr:ABC transporter substrate-binding protein [Myxococcaceae bacterium]